jgi:glycosyltransferase involved in cell wall biosynthesis
VRINVLAFKLLWFDGYGRYCLSTMKALTRAGVELRPGLVDDLDVPGWVQRLMGYDFSRTTLSVMPPHEMKCIPGRQFNLTMYESTRLPEGWAEHANVKAERLIVPCEWCANVFKDNGVQVPIDVVHGGVDPEEFPIVTAKPSDDTYTFMAFGDRGARKGSDLVWQAFYKAFPHTKDVRLVIKSRPHNYRMVDMAQSDRRVSLWREDTQSLSDVFTQADCFVFPTRGEGWGLPPREAACMGLPVITTRFSGTAVGIDHWAIPIDNYKMTTASIKGGGQWAWPDVDEVASHMRWCYENRQEAKQKGLQAAQWLRDNQTWEHSAKNLIALLEEHR